MGRYSSTAASEQPIQQGQYPQNWPTVFPKPVIGIDRNNVITANAGSILTPQDIQIVPGSLEGIRQMRLKGYKVMLFFNEPAIGNKLATSQQIDAVNQGLMQIFGNAGIFTIEGLLYSTTTFKDDIFSLPNDGMLKKAEREHKMNFKEGYFVGAHMYDLKTAKSAGARPILIKSPYIDEALEKLNMFANREIKKATKQYDSLLDFANNLS